MPTDPLFYLVALPTFFVIAFVKGGFGGGFALLGIPLLSLVVSPIEAAIMISPLVCLMDVFAIWAYPPRTWSAENLRLLMLPLLVGIGLGVLAFTYVDERWVTVMIAVVTLGFCARWFLGRSKEQPPTRPSVSGAAVWGTLAGFTTFIAHSGGAPLAIYLLPQRLPKTILAGTTVMVFLVANWTKVIPYIWLGAQQPAALKAALAASPAVPLGVWLGRKCHDRISEARLYLVCYVMLVLASLKLLYDGASKLL
jgi:uncharacterized membrane protein YfcA